MDAREAREKSLQITGSKERRQYEQVHIAISDAVNSGKLECFVYYTLLPAVEIKLHQECFKTEYSSQYNESTSKISW